LKSKIVIFSTIAVVSVIIFILKLYQIQVVDSVYKMSAENNAFRHVIQHPSRGVIFDRNGELLVLNEPSFDLKVVPGTISEFDTLEFCRIFEIEKKDIDAIFQRKQKRYRSTIVKKQISPEVYAKMQEHLYKFPGFYIEKRTIRTYPRPIAAHILGYVGEVNTREMDNDAYYNLGDYIGKSGIERTYDKYLRGEKGVKIFVVNVHGQVQESYKEGRYDTTAYSGNALTATIDVNLQEYGESLMINKIGSVVAIEPATGEILALVTSPSYDPNLFVGPKLSGNYAKVSRQKNKPLYNRAIKSRYPPGSTFKPVSALIALQENVINENTVFHLTGGYNTGSHIVHDHIAGAINLEMSIQHSSNAYYCTVFKKIITDKKQESYAASYENWKMHLHSFGLGVKLGVDLAYEDKGLIYPSTYFDRVYGEGRWNHNTIISLSIGQGELGFSPLQIANMTCVIANRGYYITPHVVKNIAGTGIDPQYLTKHYTEVEERHFKPVIEGMEKVVTAGTARSAFLEGYTICGKTGTAQNPHGKDHSIFIAFAPKDNPKIAIAVYVENAGYGSTWAAPIASLMIEKFLSDSISRPWVEKRMLEGNLLNKK